MAFGELWKSFEELEVVLEKLETRLRYHETKAQNITMAYLLFITAFISFCRAHCQIRKICNQRTQICQQIQAEAMEAGDSSNGFHFNFHLNYDSFTIFNTKLFMVSIICALLIVTTLGLLASNYKICN